MSKNRQAIVLIHGIGEQRPLETAIAFAKSISDDSEIRYKPTEFGIKGEMQRISIKENKQRPRTDIYEYYWAHKFRFNKLSTIHNWAFGVAYECIKSLFTEGFQKKKLEFIFAILLYFSIPVLLAYGAFCMLSQFSWEGLFIYGCALFFLYKAAISDVLLCYLADAAKYLSNHPDNISAREEVRLDGLKLLDNLVKSGKYSRIQVVGHSLGSVIAYDILSIYWASFIESITESDDSRKFLEQSFIDLCARSRSIKTQKEVQQFQKEQRLIRQKMCDHGISWPFSDLITIGSPLSFANYLIAKSQADFDEKINRMHFLLACPPKGSVGDVTFSRNHSRADGTRQACYFPTYNFLFVPTSWTNIYFNTDPIGGPLQSLFGNGVYDIEIKGGTFFISHVKYFVGGSGASKRIKNALKLESKLVERGRKPPQIATGNANAKQDVKSAPQVQLEEATTHP